jgi:hypothetical protein
MARVAIVHAMRKAVKLMQIMKTNIACNPLLSTSQTMSLAYHMGQRYVQLFATATPTLPMKIRPPAIRQNEVTSSEGGLEAKVEVGAEMKKRR